MGGLAGLEDLESQILIAFASPSPLPPKPRLAFASPSLASPRLRLSLASPRLCEFEFWKLNSEFSM